MRTLMERKILPYQKEGTLPVKHEGPGSFGLLRQEIDRLLEDFTPGFLLGPFRRIDERMRQFSPIVVMSESKRDITVNVELPGMDEKDVELSLTDGHIIIRGEKKEEKEEKKKGYTRTERSFGEFTRVIPVPVGVDTNKISTVFKKGLLRITMPKSEGTRTTVKKIPINSN
jgi:HSP20 family protein